MKGLQVVASLDSVPDVGGAVKLLRCWEGGLTKGHWAEAINAEDPGPIPRF